MRTRVTAQGRALQAAKAAGVYPMAPLPQFPPSQLSGRSPLARLFQAGRAWLGTDLQAALAAAADSNMPAPLLPEAPAHPSSASKEVWQVARQTRVALTAPARRSSAT
jgi:hypothetical protein